MNGLKSITGYRGKFNVTDIDKSKQPDFAEQLNLFYARFETGATHESDVHDIPGAASVDPLEPVSVLEVSSAFKNLRVGKAPGPDMLTPRVLKVCHLELSEIFCVLFNMSLSSGIIPLAWKTANIVPVPKKSEPAELNDYRPVALTSVVMKCLERLVLCRLLPHIELDDFQFAYRSNRCRNDAIVTVLNDIYGHLDRKNSYVRALFIDFSSAFNTIMPSVLIDRLTQMQVPTYLCDWIRNFLSNRKQRVVLGGSGSSLLTTNTGAPQGCVLSPTLFNIYTNSCVANFSDNTIVKYADDTVLISKITNGDESLYRQEIVLFADWCKVHNLLLNVSKTKEIILDFRSSKSVHSPVCIEDSPVTIVDRYLYLGCTITRDLSWSEHIDVKVRKASKRLFFLRKLREFGVNKKVLLTFFQSVIQSVVMDGLVFWGGNATSADRGRVDRVVKSAARIIGLPLGGCDNMYEGMVLKFANKIMSDPRHPLHACYQQLPSGRRLRSARCKTKRHQNSFVPSSIRMINS